MRLKRWLAKSLPGVWGMLCAVTSHAQGSVTLYGVVDGGLLYLSKTQGTNGANAGRFFGFTDPAVFRFPLSDPPAVWMPAPLAPATNSVS